MEATNLDDVCAVVGYTATRKLVAWFGGRNLYVPSEARPDHPLAFLIGMPALRALVRAYSVEHLAIPKHDRYARLREVCDRVVEGQTPAQIGAAMDMSARRVEQLRAELEVEGWLRYAGMKASTGGAPARRFVTALAPAAAT